MCLALPMELTSVSGDSGTAELGGASVKVRLTLLEAPAAGDFVLVHAGFAIQKLDRAQAESDLALFETIRRKAEGAP